MTLFFESNCTDFESTALFLNQIVLFLN